MSRSLWKTPFSALKVEEEETKAVEEQVWSRNSTILPTHLGRQVRVHNGKSWVRVHVAEQMIAHKYGEFASTRKRAIHKSKLSQQNSRKK